MTNAQLEAQIKLADDETNKGNYDAAQILAQQVIDVLDNRSDDITPTENDPNSNGTENSNNLSDEMHDATTIRANAILALAWNNLRQGNFDIALEQAHLGLVQALEGDITSSITNAWNTIGNVHVYLGNYDNALEFFNKALAINEESGSKDGIARNLTSIGNVYVNLSDYPQVLTYYQKALAINEEIGRKNGIATNLGNIGIVYQYLSDYPQALTYYQKALAIYEEIGSKNGIANNLGNIGNVYHNLSDYPQALTYYQKSLAINEEIASKNGIATNLGNIGIVYQYLSDYPQALTYYQKSLAINEEIASKDGIATSLGNIGWLYANKEFDGYDTDKAEEFLLRAIALSEDIGEKQHLYNFHKSLADLYETQERWKEHSIQFKKYHTLEKEVQSEDAHKQAGLMEQRRQAAEREKEIAIANAAASARHEATVQLLHNVLPRSIADKMLDGTKLIAEKIPNVSVLFADIVNFTKLSGRITPEELVEGLDRIFSTFDALAEKHGLEKIKTIGDAYMVVSGAPVQRDDHAEAMAHFALEMLEAMKEFRSISTGEEIQLRIGIHSGEVVAGVIGKKKFAYDLWGDAVNTASRMESHGEPGKIHCTEEFMRALSLSSQLSPTSPHFTERGEIDIKGKGLMKTYFLEQAT